MKIKHIVLDLDGTLLNSNRTLSAENIEALRICALKGYDIWVATARPFRLVYGEKGVLRDLDFLEEKGIFYNGAYVYDNSTGYSKHYPISSTLTKSIIDHIKATSPDTKIAIQNQEKYHSFNKPDHETYIVWGFPAEECIEIEEAVNHSCSKIVIWDESRDLTSLYASLIERFRDDLNIYITDSSHWIQIMSKKATKENALQELLHNHGVKLDEVVVFGDDIPDLGMMKMFYHSVAVGNAKPEIKQIARYLTLNNDENGVSYALREILRLLP